MEERAPFGDPEAAVPGGGDRSDIAAEQALARRQRGHLDVAETVQAGVCHDPDIPFPVFKDVVHGVARQPIGAGELLGSPLHAPDQPMVRADPQGALSIGEHLPGFDLRLRRAGIALPTARREPPDSRLSGARQQIAIRVVSEGEDRGHVHQSGETIDLMAIRLLRRLRPPPAGAALPAQPDIALPVLVQRCNVAELVLIREPEAPERTALETAEGRHLRNNPRVAHPDHAPAVLEESAEAPPLRIHHELPVSPARQALGRSNPKAAVTGSQEADDPVVRKLRSRRRLPGIEPHAVKTDQPGLGSNPQESVFRLGDRARLPGEVSIADTPRGVAVLREGVAGVEAGGGRGEQQRHE